MCSSEGLEMFGTVVFDVPRCTVGINLVKKTLRLIGREGHIELSAVRFLDARTGILDDDLAKGGVGPFLQLELNSHDKHE